MGVNVVQLHAKSLLEGLPSPLYDKGLLTVITPPSPGDLDGPTAYVWATLGTNKRQTAPRRAGFRKMMWTVTVWLMSPDNATNPEADSAFACLIDAVVTAFTTAEMPISIIDPNSGQNYNFLAIGEQFTVTQSPVHGLANQQLFLYEALCEFTIEETSQQ
jgi:hypothetical protein